MQQNDWGVDQALKVVRIDIDPEEHARLRRPDVSICADAAQSLDALLDRLAAHNRKRESRAEELAGHRAWLAEQLALLQPQTSYLQAIHNAYPGEGIFVDEVTQVGFAARLAFPVEKPRTYLSPGYQDNLGWGLGTALGAKAARPDVPVLLISGDGGFLFQLGELATAVQHGLGIIMVVFDNNAYGNVRRIQQQQFGGRLIACELVNPDFLALAESFGIKAVRANSPDELSDEVGRAVGEKGPTLIHVPHTEAASPWPMIRMPKVRG
jgi:acetolactate synthase-1/2/3 large subunit